MITTKEELKYYISEDWLHCFSKDEKPPWYEVLFFNDVWKFQVALRKHEYYANRKSFLRYFWALRHYKLGLKLGFDIPINVFGPGLNIHHYGYIVVNGKAKVGSNCNIQQGVNIGEHRGGAPKLGDDIFIGPGAKLFGDIIIADGIKIGANSVVNHSFIKKGISVVGIPAKEVVEHGYDSSSNA